MPVWRIRLAHTPAAMIAAAAFYSTGALANCCPIVELRQYTLFPGKRDELVALFEDKFIESQEDAGMRIIGQFRDVNDANRFVWLRGFEGMEPRKKALTDFYYGPVWQSHRSQANATLFDNDNVLLLHPASPDSGFAHDARAPACA